jgi:glycosyltransferase involved in cell wall biosynthesis
MVSRDEQAAGRLGLHEGAQGMRIVYLAPNIPIPGAHGGSTHVTSVHRALGRRHEMLTVGRRDSTEPGVIAAGIPIGIGPTAGHLLAGPYYLYLAAKVRRFQPDIVYERYSAFGLGIALQRALRIPSILMTLDRDASPISFRFADRIAATSDEFIPERYRFKYREVHWGVDIDKIARADGSEVRRRLAPHGERLVVYTGSCLTWHGLDVLVEAAAQWAGPPVIFVVVGDGPELARIRRLAAARRVLDRFAFEGRVPHDAIGPYIAAADACIAPYAPSRHPIFRAHGMNRDPIKVLEYMAAGKPAVTIDTPRMRALFRAGEQAILYPPEDASALAAMLSSLLLDPLRARQVGDAGALLVHERFSWDRHAQELEAIFEEALKERAAGA